MTKKTMVTIAILQEDINDLLCMKSADICIEPKEVCKLHIKFISQFSDGCVVRAFLYMLCDQDGNKSKYVELNLLREDGTLYETKRIDEPNGLPETIRWNTDGTEYRVDVYTSDAKLSKAIIKQKVRNARMVSLYNMILDDNREELSKYYTEEWMETYQKERELWLSRA